MAVYTEVAKLSMPYLVQGVAETIVTTDQALALMPIFDVSPAIQYTWNQESTIATNNSASLILPDGTFTPLSASYTQTTSDLTFVGASFNLPRALATENAIATEISKKAKAVARTMGRLLIVGNKIDYTNCQFNGLKQTLSGSSTQDFNPGTTSVPSGALSLGVLDQAIAAVKVGRPNLIVTSNAGMRYFKNAIRSTGTTAQMLQLENYGAPVLAYDNIPIVASDWVSDTEQNAGTSFYVLYCNELDGVSLWANYDQIVTVAGPVPVVNSLSDNYTVGGAFGFVFPSALCGARVYGVIS